MKRFEIEINGEVFCVQDIEGLCAKLSIVASASQSICTWASMRTEQDLQLGWILLRRLYGIGPAVPPVGALKDEDYSPACIEEVSARFSIPIDQIDRTIALLHKRWVQDMSTNPDAAEAPAPKRRGRQAKAPPPEVDEKRIPPLPVPDSSKVSDAEMKEIEAVVVHYGFTMETFNLAMREDDHRRVEARWFASRLIEIQKLFDDVSTKSLARQAVINEMHMRRIDDEMARLPPLNAKFWQYQDAKIKLEEIYSTQWAQIEKLNPTLRTQQTKRAFAGVISEIIEGIRDYQADPKNETVDGVFTALELQVEMRSSKQQGGDVQYRPDIVIAINEARRCIWDPKFKRKLDDKHLKLIGFAFHEAVKAFTEKTGIKVPDLAADDGEHPPLYIPPPEQSSLEALERLRIRNENDWESPVVPPEHAIPLS